MKIEKIIFCVCLSAFLFCAAFTFLSLGFLSFICLIPFFYVFKKTNSLGRLLLACFIFGVIVNFNIFFWITNVFWPILIFAVLFNTLFIAGFGYLLYLLKPVFSDYFVLAAPFFWVAMEYFKELGLFNFPAPIIGYTLVPYTNLLNLSKFGTVRLISFLIIIANAIIFLLLSAKNKKQRFAYIFLCILFFSVWSIAGSSLSRRAEGQSKKTIRIALIQGNISPETQWSTAFIDNIFKIYEKLTYEAVKYKPDLIIWPEDTIPCFIFHPERKNYLDALEDLSKKIKVPLLVGTQDLKFRERKYVYNSAVLFDEGKIKGKYDKIKLIPIAENVPVKRFIPFFRSFNLGCIFDPGTEYTVFKLGKLKFGTLICFEGMFPSLVRKFKAEGADFIVNITNDAPALGHMSLYRNRNFDILKLRAMENSLPVVRCSNDGISGLIDMDGRVLARFPLYKRGVFVVDVPIS